MNHVPNAPASAPAPAAKPVWQSRTGTPSDGGFLTYSQSVAEDRAFVEHDIAGSIAHVIGLHAAGLVNPLEATALITGLQSVARMHQSGRLVLDPALEDVHMNLEAALGDTAGASAAKVHTGRSRNDQVATCLTLYAREGLAKVAASSHQLATELAAAAEMHAETPWLATTHGQPAQPATLGFLLSAHALRFHALANDALYAFDALNVCPLGAGAVAGSTLPLKPEVAAKALGLAPLEHALIAAGTRDVVVKACTVAAGAGPLLAGLAADLLALHAQGGYTPPATHTSGSSLMPQKRNPDALELARAHGNALGAPLASVLGTVSGLGLGYHRDFQQTKPQLVSALTSLQTTLQILLPHITQGTFHPEVLASGLSKPGIGATDAAEALVAKGIPFRDAYHTVAQVMSAALERAVPLENALAATSLSAGAQAAALAAFTADPTRRTTRGGPAPAAVRATLARLAPRLDAQATQTTAAQDAAATPFHLLSASPASLLEPLVTL